MPQITLKISNNIDVSKIDFHPLFAAIHNTLKDAPNLNIHNCQSGVIQENFSYIGAGDNKKTKMFLEIYWLENAERLAIKKVLAEKLMKLLEDMIVPQIEKQKLICIPKVRIANLGLLEQDFFMSKLANK